MLCVRNTYYKVLVYVTTIEFKAFQLLISVQSFGSFKGSRAIVLPYRVLDSPERIVSGDQILNELLILVSPYRSNVRYK